MCIRDRNTSGCGTTIKDYSFIFKDHSDKSLRKKAKVISDIALDITEYLEESIKLDFTRTNHSKRYNIAYHSACSMQHGQKVHDQPIELLKKTGNNILEVPDGHTYVVVLQVHIIYCMITLPLNC